VQDGKISHGYTAAIPQPWLIEREHAIWKSMDARVDRSAQIVPRCRIGDPRVRLSPELLNKVGEFAHVVQRGIQQCYSSDENDKTILQSLHMQGVDEAKGLLYRLGRRGRVPWLASRYRQKLPYIDPETSVVLPPAHNMLHGVLHSFIAFGVGKVTGWRPRRMENGSRYSADAVNQNHSCCQGAFLDTLKHKILTTPMLFVAFLLGSGVVLTRCSFLQRSE
jgi:hypothetical protein